MAAPHQPLRLPPAANNYASDDSDPEEERLKDDEDVRRWMVTEAALNRWSRYPAEAQRCVVSPNLSSTIR